MRRASGRAGPRAGEPQAPRHGVHEEEPGKRQARCGLPAPPWPPPAHAARSDRAAPAAPHGTARTSPGAPAIAAGLRRSSRGGTLHGLPRSGTGSQTLRPGDLPRTGILPGQRVSLPGKASHGQCEGHGR